MSYVSVLAAISIALMTSSAVAQPAATSPTAAPPTVVAALQDDPGFYSGEAGLTPSEIAGREIWYKATAGNARFHTYVFQQRTGILIDWFRALRSDQRDDRFAAYGLINDPGCCAPGSEGCPAKSLEETYGFDWCPGDADLLKFVGKEGYRDPACDFRDAPPETGYAVHYKGKDQRQSNCDLAFGTSTGALGFRKFPNPRFDKARWLKANGKLDTWEGFSKKISKDPASTDSRFRHLANGAIEPPFLIGTSCGSCHISFDPLNPPQNPAKPKWENIKGLLGNQYLRISEILGSGMAYNSLEYQMFSHTRPGTSDTSAIPNDQIANSGTINPLINLERRPTFKDQDIIKWHPVAACSATPEAGTTCWCEPGRSDKCWVKKRSKETVHNILKGGEDSTGALEAIQRVYFNIGSCSEQCWVNHLTDLRQIDPQARNFGQSRFDVGQCRRDCPNMRAIEDRLTNIKDFLFSREARPTDLHVAREQVLKRKDPKAQYSYDALVAALDKQFGKNAVKRGSQVFADNCARCHSSIPESEGGAFQHRDFRAANDQGMRLDWLGNDQLTPVTEVGTYRCRALHSNHMKDHVWEEYGSETLRARAKVAGVKEPNDGGRGYYRNVSLISLWAHAPFAHNNAIGPEICGQPKNRENFFYRSPYVDRASKQLLPDDKAPVCMNYDPDVEGRFSLYVKSMEDLLNPAQRVPKITKLDVDVPLPLELRSVENGEEKKVVGLTVLIPKGTTAAGLVNFRHKDFANDLVQLKLDPQGLEQRLAKDLGPEEATATVNELRSLVAEFLKQPKDGKVMPVAVMRSHPKLVEFYSNCTADIENDGHPFGQDLSEADKKALIAFLATM